MMTTKHLLDVALKEIERLKKKLQQERKEFLEDLKAIMKATTKINVHIYGLQLILEKWEAKKNG